jgi:cyanophycinase-like exopeptidase
VQDLVKAGADLVGTSAGAQIMAELLGGGSVATEPDHPQY